MKVDKLTLERVFERTERLEAPLFQRPYVWKQVPNWESLWDSIQMVAERRLEERLIQRPLHPHFLGTIVLDQLNTGIGKIHARQIIDGQQRLTTLQLALAAARDLCARLSESRYSKAFEKLTVNDVPLSDDPDHIFKVWPTNNADQRDFRDVMNARAAALVRKMEHRNGDADWLIPSAYLYFNDTFDEWLGPAGTDVFQQRLNSLYSTMRDDLHLVVIDLEANDDAQLVVELLRELHSADDFSSSAIRRFLLKQESDISRWPTDEEFTKAWSDLQFYKRLKRKTRMILEALETALHTGRTERVTIEAKLTMEHLMPREWRRHWPLAAPDGTAEAKEQAELRDGLVHTIGNLTLLTKELNPSVSNGPWDRKLDGILKHSALNLNRTLSKRRDEAEIQTRTGELMKIALKVWPHPTP